MAKVSKKQLGRRRRGALYVLILLIVLMIVLISSCNSARKKKAAEEASVTIQITEPAVTTTAPLMPGVLYTGGAAVMTTTEAAVPEITTPTPDLPEEPETISPTKQELSVNPVMQNPELPTGCEITSLTMALNYAGYSVDKLTMADEYLIRAEPYQTTFGEAFVGSPHDETAWGCYVPVIVETAKKYISAQNGTETVQNLTGCSLNTLLNKVANGTPVITWVTIGLTSEAEEKFYWTTPEGKDAVFIKNEHCVLLTGYNLDNNTVTVCDPLKGLIVYDKDTFEKCYQLLYQQAAVIRSAAFAAAEEAAEE